MASSSPAFASCLHRRLPIFSPHVRKQNKFTLHVWQTSIGHSSGVPPASRLKPVASVDSHFCAVSAFDKSSRRSASKTNSQNRMVHQHGAANTDGQVWYLLTISLYCWRRASRLF